MPERRRIQRHRIQRHRSERSGHCTKAEREVRVQKVLMALCYGNGLEPLWEEFGGGSRYHDSILAEARRRLQRTGEASLEENRRSLLERLRHLQQTGTAGAAASALRTETMILGLHQTKTVLEVPTLLDPRLQAALVDMGTGTPQRPVYQVILPPVASEAAPAAAEPTPPADAVEGPTPAPPAQPITDA